MSYRPLSRLLAPVLVVILVLSGLMATAPAARAAERDRIKISIANVGSIAKPRVGGVLDRRRPHLMIISEAYRARRHLKGVAEREGYKLRQFRPRFGEEAPGIALLVRKDVEIKKRVAMKMTEPWWWKGNKREPRVYPAIVLRVKGRRWNVVGVHYPPGGPDGGGSNTGGRNKPAWQESKRRVQRYARNHPRPPVVGAGDFNALAGEMRDAFPGWKVQKGGKVDHAITKRHRGARFDWIRRDEPRSGHGWITFRVSAAPK